MAVSPRVRYNIAPQSLVQIASDNQLGVIDIRVLLYMIGNCAFHILSVFDADEFYVKAPDRFPEGTAGCFIYNGKRSEILEGLNYSVPQNVSRSVNTLIRRQHLSRTNQLGLRTMFAFVLHPKFFQIL